MKTYMKLRGKQTRNNAFTVYQQSRWRMFLTRVCIFLNGNFLLFWSNGAQERKPTMLLDTTNERMTEKEPWKEFQVGQKALIYKPRLKMFLGKWKSRCSGLFIINKVFAYGATKVQHLGDLHTFTTIGKSLNIYSRGEIPTEKVSPTVVEP